MIQLHFKTSFAGQFKFFPLIPLLNYILIVNGFFLAFVFIFSVLIPIYKQYEPSFESKLLTLELQNRINLKLNREKITTCPKCGRKRLLNDKYCQNCGQTLQSLEEFEHSLN